MAAHVRTKRVGILRCGHSLRDSVLLRSDIRRNVSLASRHASASRSIRQVCSSTIEKRGRRPRDPLLDGMLACQLESEILKPARQERLVNRAAVQFSTTHVLVADQRIMVRCRYGTLRQFGICASTIARRRVARGSTGRLGLSVAPQ
jgi:hypothetical protein